MYSTYIYVYVPYQKSSHNCVNIEQIRVTAQSKLVNWATMFVTQSIITRSLVPDV